MLLMTDGMGVVVTGTLAYVVDEPGPVAALDDLDGPHPAAPVQGEALAPAWDPVRVDAPAHTHGAPGGRGGGRGRERERER